MQNLFKISQKTLVSKLSKTFTFQKHLSKNYTLYKKPLYKFSLKNEKDNNTSNISLDLPEGFSLKDSILNEKSANGNNKDGNNVDSPFTENLEEEIEIPVDEENESAEDYDSNLDSELEIPNISKSKKSKQNAQQVQSGSQEPGSKSFGSKSNSDTPLWMRFFTSSEPLKVDIQRSVKSENNDLIQNYIKGSYNMFNYEQLVICLARLQRSSMQQKVLLEIKRRIVLNKCESNYSLDFQLLKNAFEVVMVDKFFQSYLTVTFEKHFDLYSKEQQTDIIKYLLIINKISPEIIQKYLKIFSEDKDENGQNVYDYLQQLSPESLSYHINVLVFLSKFIKPDVFKQYVPQRIVDFYFDLQCKNLQENFTHHSQASYIEMEKLVPQEIPYFLTWTQKQSLKKLIAEKLILRFNVEESKGRFLHYKKDKTISRFIRNIFEPTDKQILEQVIVLFGNYLLIREKTDYKFDFKLFSYLQRYNYAYKLYLDEALWPIKNLTKAFMNSLKRQGTLDHALAFIVLHKLKIYFSLNYETIVQEEQLEYRKNVWNKIIKDNIYNIEEYLTQLQSSNLLDRVLMFPERVQYEELIKNGQQNQQDIQTDKENSKQIQPPIESEMETINQKQNSIIDEDDNDNDSEYMYASDAVSNVEKSSQMQHQDENLIKDKIQKEKYIKEKEKKMQEYAQQIEKSGFIQLNKYETKISIHSTIPLKYYINLVQAITSLIYNYNNFTPNFFIVLNEFLHKPKHVEIFNHFTLVPGILESFCLIQEYKNRNVSLEWLPVEINDKLLEIREEINSIFSKNEGNGQKILKYIEQEVKSLNPNEWHRDKGYDEELFYKEIQNHSYFTITPNGTSQNPHQSSDIIKQNQKRDYLNERFIYSKTNLLQKVLNSDLLRMIINESHFKKIVENNLKQMDLKSKIIKNHVQYPCMADFFLEDYQTVIQVLDNQKLVGGVEGIMSGFYQKSERYYVNKGYKVVYINYKDYDVSPADFQKRLQEIIYDIQ